MSILNQFSTKNYLYLEYDYCAADWQLVCDDYNGTVCHSKGGVFACVCGERYRRVGLYPNESHIDECELLASVISFETVDIPAVIILLVIFLILPCQICLLIFWLRRIIEKSKNSRTAFLLEVGDQFTFQERSEQVSQGLGNDT